MIASTKTDAAINKWSIDDRVIRLREWGSDTIRVLPQPSLLGPAEVSIGSAETCSLTLHDPTGRVSRLHASLVRERENNWSFRDLSSKNGVRLNGAHCSQIALEPGDEIGIGGLTLIAESRRWIALRGFLARLLGWRSERFPVVDHALRSVRMAAARRAPLVLRGDGDLVPIARAIHRRTLGADRPFIVCDPRRRKTGATVRSAENYETGMPAFAAATGGTLCARTLRLPKDFYSVITAFRDPNTQVRLVLCARTPADCDLYLAVPITMSPLTTR